MLGSITLAVALAGAAAGASHGTGGGEAAAPPDPLVVTTGSGMPLTGAPAVIDIRYADAAKPPEVELSLSASDGAGRAWSALVAAPVDLLHSATLTATVVDRPLQTGEASVSVRFAGGDATFARGGLFELRLRSGWIEGRASGMDAPLSATFEGPFVMTCAVPAAAMAGSNADRHEAAALMLDERFESDLCRPHATLAAPPD